jgi:hypothetical protein
MTFDAGYRVLDVYFIGNRFAGWMPVEEYADGSQFQGGGFEIAGTFMQYGVVFTLLMFLLVIFLKKYHAGEVGVLTASYLFAMIAVFSIAWNYFAGPSLARHRSDGDRARHRDRDVGFKFIFYDLPVAVLVFFAWAWRGYARDAGRTSRVLRRDPPPRLAERDRRTRDAARRPARTRRRRGSVRGRRHPHPPRVGAPDDGPDGVHLQQRTHGTDPRRGHRRRARRGRAAAVRHRVLRAQAHAASRLRARRGHRHDLVHLRDAARPAAAGDGLRIRRRRRGGAISSAAILTAANALFYAR